MGVGDGKAVGGVAGDRGLVTRHAHLLHRIGDGDARVVHGQIGEAARPAVGRVEGERFTGVLPVGQQADGDGIRALAVLVVRVVPDLFNGYGGLFGRVGVGDGKAVGGVAGDPGRVTLHVHFLHRIDDGGALFVRIQIGEAALPAVGRVEGERCVGVLPVGQQADGDGLRTLAVLIVRVVPDLFNGYGGLFGRVGVGDGKAVGGVAGDRGLVTRHAHLLHRIGDGDARVVHGQIGEAARPAVGRVEGERFAGILPAGQQADGDGLRTHAVLIVRVVPVLLHGKIHTLRLVRHLYRYAVGEEVGEVGKPRPVQLGVLLAAFQGVIAALFHHQVSPAGVGLHKGDGCPLLRQAGIGGVLSVPGIFQMHAQRTGAVGHGFGVEAVDGIAAGVVGYGVIGGMILGLAVDRLEDLILSFPDDFPPRLVHKGRIRVKLHRIGRRRVKFGGDMVQGHVDFVVRGKGPHAADQIARFKAHAHAVVRRAGVHVNAGVVHHHRDGGAVFQIARRRARFDQVVVALREQLVVAEDEPPVLARDAGQPGGAAGGIAAARYRHIARGVERKCCAFERLILLVHFQHAQLVAEVGHIEVGKELALHAGTLGKRVHEPGVVTVDVLHGVRLGIVVEHAVFGVVAPVCGERVIVFGNIAGQLVNRDLPGAAGTQLKPAGVFRQGRLNVLPAAAILHRPSVDGVAVDGAPVAGGVLHEDHAEHLPWRCA